MDSTKMDVIPDGTDAMASHTVLTSFNIEARRRQLRNLNQFISSSKEEVQGILSRLGWTAEKVKEDNDMVMCSIDATHKIPAKSLANHTEKCTIRKEGYSLSSTFLSEPLNIPGQSLKLDDHKKLEILSAAHSSVENFKSGWDGKEPNPRTSDRLMSTFSKDERLVLYDYVRKYTSGPQKPPEFNLEQPRLSTKVLTEEELEQRRRDARRRRIKYKSVHTNRKNHVEVLREVIHTQMALYKDWLNEDNDSATATRQSSLDRTECDQTVRSGGENDKRLSEKGSHKQSNGSFREKDDNTPRKRYREDEHTTNSRSHKSSSKQDDQYRKRSSRQEYFHYRSSQRETCYNSH